MKKSEIKALSFVPVGGGMVCSCAEPIKWVFRTLTNVHGNTLYSIGCVDEHSESWHEVTKKTFVKVQRQLRARLK